VANPSIFKEFLLFLKEEKKWWLVPLVAILLVLGTILVLISTSVWGSFIYPFF